MLPRKFFTPNGRLFKTVHPFKKPNLVFDKFSIRLGISIGYY